MGIKLPSQPVPILYSHSTVFFYSTMLFFCSYHQSCVLEIRTFTLTMLDSFTDSSDSLLPWHISWTLLNATLSLPISFDASLLIFMHNISKWLLHFFVFFYVITVHQEYISYLNFKMIQFNVLILFLPVEGLLPQCWPTFSQHCLSAEASVSFTAIIAALAASITGCVMLVSCSALFPFLLICFCLLMWSTLCKSAGFVSLYLQVCLMWDFLYFWYYIMLFALQEDNTTGCF